MSDSQGVEPVQQFFAEPVQLEVAEHPQLLESKKTPEKLNAEPVEPRVAESVPSQDAEPVHSKVTESVQSKDAELVHSKVAEPVQSKDAEPVHSKVAEPVQSKDAAPGQSKVAEPDQSKATEPGQSKVAGPVPSKDREPLPIVEIIKTPKKIIKESQLAEPVQSRVTKHVQLKLAEPALSNVAEPVQSTVAKPVQSKVGQTKEMMKSSIRKNIWDQLYRNKIVVHPLPFGRIPNFIGVELASEKLLDLDVFHKAKSVEVSPDKPLEPARLLVLNNKKELYVPCPGLDQSLMKKLELDQEHDIKAIVTRWGIDHLGKSIEMEDKFSVDLIVTGSVAVSENGYRIGKGQGYTDIEFAVLKEMKAINDNTVIVTIVHDSQVIDLPKDIFKKYDVPVDYILTPTRTIKVKHELPKPEGLFWSEFTARQLKHRQFFRDLKLKHEREGRDTTLKVETAEDRYQRVPFFIRRNYFKRRPNPRTVDGKTIAKKGGPAEQSTRKIPPRSTPVKDAGPNSATTADPLDDIENISPPRKTMKRKKKPSVDYSLRVSNIQKTVRVRELKMALKERGIKPNNIAWKGSRGYCYLHYAKKKQKVDSNGEGSGVDEGSDAINSVIELIQKLKIHSEKCLTVEVMQPITRIETVDVTAV